MDSLNLYDFNLPKELIASTPGKTRGDSRLMCLLKGEEHPRHDHFQQLSTYLRKDDVLVINNTQVMKARLSAFKETLGKCEILLCRPLPDGRWEALVKGLGPGPNPRQLRLGSLDGPTINVWRNGQLKTCEIATDTDLADYAENYGEMPLPPYMNRKATPEDDVRYQTVYAKTLGAVASPTAGLHFTDEHLSALKSMGIMVVEITLHVGPGTFLPITSPNIADHTMHREFFRLNDEAAQKLNLAKAKNRRIVAVGTTSMRVLEQVLLWAEEKSQHQFFAVQGDTNIFIKPGHIFRACDALITNFHVPQSTLLVLVSAFVGRDRILAAYREAVQQQYRFFSYGDACYLEVNN